MHAGVLHSFSVGARMSCTFLAQKRALFLEDVVIFGNSGFMDIFCHWRLICQNRRGVCNVFPLECVFVARDAQEDVTCPFTCWLRASEVFPKKFTFFCGVIATLEKNENDQFLFWSLPFYTDRFKLPENFIISSNCSFLDTLFLAARGGAALLCCFKI